MGPMGSNSREIRLRALVSQEAARIIIDEGVQDFQLAKRKAAMRLKLSDHHLLPRNIEIEQALQERQRLFQGERHAQHVRELRTAALRAMELLDEFKPRLTGSVLSGSAGLHSNVNLHLFAESSEEVIIRLLELGIPYQPGEKRLRSRPDSAAESLPSIRFGAAGIDIELIVFPLQGLRQSPLSPVDGRPMPRADSDKVRKLLEERL
jgi:hypothetical protein